MALRPDEGRSEGATGTSQFGRVRLNPGESKPLKGKAAEHSRTPKPCGVLRGTRESDRFWSAAVLCRFHLQPLGFTTRFNHSPPLRHRNDTNWHQIGRAS